MYYTRSISTLYQFSDGLVHLPKTDHVQPNISPPTIAYQISHRPTSQFVFEMPDDGSMKSQLFESLGARFRLGERVQVPVAKRLFQLWWDFWKLYVCGKSPESSVSERARSQLFRTSKKFKIGSLPQKLRAIMYLTLMMENDRLLSLGTQYTRLCY